MVSERVTVRNKLGLHARAASVFVNTAMQFSSAITLQNAEKTANGKSIMSMMLLEAPFGTELEMQIEGEDELSSLVALVDQRFGEDE